MQEKVSNYDLRLNEDLNFQAIKSKDQQCEMVDSPVIKNETLSQKVSRDVRSPDLSRTAVHPRMSYEIVSQTIKKEGMGPQINFDKMKNHQVDDAKSAKRA